MSEEKVNMMKGEETPERGVSTTVSSESEEREEVREPRDNYEHYADHTFHNNVTIGGVLRTKRFFHPHGGLFLTEGKLLEELPDPRVGWWAMVGAQWPMQIYICREAGKWSRAEEGKWEYTHRLDIWEEYIAGNGDILSADLGYQLKEEIGRLEKEIGKIPSLTGYAKESWVEGKGYATQAWVEGKNYLTQQSLSGYAKESWVEGKGYATQTWVEGKKYLTEAKGKELFASLTSFESLKDDFESMFEKVNIGTEKAPVYAIRAKLGLYTEEFLSARGLNPFATDMPVGIDEKRLGEYLLENGYAKRSDLPSLTGYATEKWVTDKNYLTSSALTPYLKSKDAADLYQPKGDYLIKHQDIYALTFEAGSFTDKSYNPKSAAVTVNIPTTTSHITEGSNKYFTDVRAQSALAGTVAELNTSIGLKLDTSTFEDFKKLWEEYFTLEDKNGEKRIRANYGLYTESCLSARGMNGTGATVTAGLDWKEIEKELGLHGYATQAWVEGKQYLTGITKAQVEGVLTGNITSHSHSQYLASSSYTAADVLAKIKGVDGTGSGLDADLLDGLQGSRYLECEGSNNYITITVGGDADKYYPVLISPAASYYPAMLINISRTYNEPAPDTWNTSTHRGGLTACILWNNSKYWDGNSNGVANQRLIQITESYSKMFGGIGNATTGMIVWLRGGGAVYHIHSAKGTSLQATVYTTSYTDGANQVFSALDAPKDYSTYRRLDIAATQLQTSRTLWGQSFNGTANVSGDMTGVGNITASGRNTVKGALLASNDKWGSDNGHFRAFSSAASNPYILGFGASEDGYGIIQSSRQNIGAIPLLINPKGGNVGIGTTAPTEKLDVNGNIKATSGVFDDQLRSKYLFFKHPDTTKGYYLEATAEGALYIGQHDNFGGIGQVAHFGADKTFSTYGNSILRNSVLIGDTSNNGSLEIYHSTPYIDFHYGRSTADYTTRIIEEASGRLAILGTLRVSVGMYSDGYVSARGQNTSDVRLKTDIRDFNASEIIKALHPVTFKWNTLARSRFKVLDTDELQYGLIAQETDKVAPWLVNRNMFGDGLWGVHYERLIPVLAQAQKEVTLTVDDLLVRVRRLEKENREMKKRMESLNKA